jgi:hypothetical protein
MTTNLGWRNMPGFHLPGLIVQGSACSRAHLELNNLSTNCTERRKRGGGIQVS